VVDARLEIRLGLDDDADAAELADAASRLRRELLRLPVTDVRLASTESPPPGARGVEAVEAGALLVALAQTPSLVSSVGQAVSAWITSRHGRSAVVQLGEDRIELSGVSHDDQQRMLELFERAHGRGRA
jgi:membrane-associated two-gene conflict system component 1 (EACC1)